MIHQIDLKQVGSHQEKNALVDAYFTDLIYQAVEELNFRFEAIELIKLLHIESTEDNDKRIVRLYLFKTLFVEASIDNNIAVIESFFAENPSRRACILSLNSLYQRLQRAKNKQYNENSQHRIRVSVSAKARKKMDAYKLKHGFIRIDEAVSEVFENLEP